jgi:uncharacterized DUF497 family protein
VKFYFTWNPKKAVSNRRKHGISFEEASTVFPDPLARIEWDADQSELEARELILGKSFSGRLLVVSFVQRGSAIRVISARLATRRERHVYQEA